MAEDSLVHQTVTRQMLAALGHRADVVADGRAAVDAVEQGDYDVVLMDLQMPGTGGLEATASILARVPAARRPRIFALTASSRPEDHRACVRAGMSGVLVKPMRAADLARTLRGVAGPVAAPGVGAAPDVEPMAALDLAVFAQVTTDMGAQSPSRQQELIEAYLEQGDGWIVDLATAAAEGDARTVRAVAHSLGSTSALLGALPLARLLSEAGRLAKIEGAGLAEAAAAVSSEYRRVAAVLHEQSTRLAGRTARTGGEP